jgi:hypothetical protein
MKPSPRHARCLSLAISLLPLAAFADSTRITSGLQSIAAWMVAPGLALSTIGLGYAAYQMNFGREEGKERAVHVLTGAVLLVSASTIIALLNTFFG